MNDEHVALLVKPGAVGVMLTDTIYGLVARATDQAAVTRLYGLKDRHEKPGTLIAANSEQLEELGIKHRYLSGVMQFWPGQVSVIIPCGPELAYLHQGISSLAVRITDDPRVVSVLERTGPLLTSSANQPGEPPAHSVREAEAYFGNSVDFYSDGGTVSDALASTVIRIIDDSIEIVRQGAVIIETGE
jgi:L-threonylcarbamoyladenylate synthase